MKRTQIFRVATLLGLSAIGVAAARSDRPGERLIAPETGKIPVAFVIARGATVIDFAGPWEVFQDVMVPGRGTTPAEAHPFELYTVAEDREPIRASAGLTIVPNYTFEDAPAPRIIVIPAQRQTQAALDWVRKASAGADLTFSVCTGAFLLARTGLLDGRAATTHHEFLEQFAREFPRIQLKRDVRYVEGPRFATAAGLTSGIDLSLRVVERYFGEETAARTARYMEHDGEGWRSDLGYWDSSTGEVVDLPAQLPPPALRGLDPVALVAGSEVEGLEDLQVTHGEYRYLFGSEANRQTFLSDPARFEIQLQGACAAMAGQGAPPGSGDPGRYHIHDGRIYIFASESCREHFKQDPGRFLKGGNH